jgi:hypothetical protein
MRMSSQELTLLYIYEFVLVCWFEPKLDIIIVYKKSYASWISLLLSSQEEKVNLAESLICRIFGISFMVDKWESLSLSRILEQAS